MILDLAYKLMREYHATQVDKSGQPYYLHPERVAALVAHLGSEYRQVALLHDIVEDTLMTLERLKGHGFSDAVLLAVDYMTKRKGEKYFDYIARIKSNDLARAVKAADAVDNMRPGAPEWMYERYRKTLVTLAS